MAKKDEGCIMNFKMDKVFTDEELIEIRNTDKREKQLINNNTN
jgi:hypothetical protein